jgi:hypothetical protein
LARGTLVRKPRWSRWDAETLPEPLDVVPRLVLSDATF